MLDLLKFKRFEKTTKCEKNLPPVSTFTQKLQNKREIFFKFVAFLENLNFNVKIQFDIE